MRLLPLLVLLGLAVPALAQPPATQPIGRHGAWTAATQGEGAQRVCYAFAQATGTPRAAGPAMLMVSHRPQGRDQVAIQPGHAYPRQADGSADPVQLAAGGPRQGFYAAGTSAFARDGAAAVAVLKRGREAVVTGPGPAGANGARPAVTDRFPLDGFTAAYEAISAACPAADGARRR